MSHDPSHFLPAQPAISFDLWIRPRKFSRSIAMAGRGDKYIIQTGIVRDSWAWEMRIEDTPFGSKLVYEYWMRDSSLLWVVQSYSTGEYVSMLIPPFRFSLIYISNKPLTKIKVPDRQWSHIWYTANSSTTCIIITVYLILFAFDEINILILFL